jgi:hypothetical protein
MMSINLGITIYKAILAEANLGAFSNRNTLGLYSLANRAMSNIQPSEPFLVLSSCFTLSIERNRQGGIPNIMSTYESPSFCRSVNRSFITMGLQSLLSYLQRLSLPLYAPCRNYTDRGIFMPVSSIP